MASTERIRPTDIHAKRIFRVEFSPVIGNEFKDEHPAIIIKSGEDVGTALVVPITSVPTGAGNTKMQITIPANNVGLNKISYAYYEGVRQVAFYDGHNVGRFRYTRDRNTNSIVQLYISDSEYNELMSKVLDSLFTKVSDDYKLKYHTEKLSELSSTKLYEHAKVIYDYTKSIASIEEALRSKEYIYANAKIQVDYKSKLSKSAKRKGLHKIIDSVLDETLKLISHDEIQTLDAEKNA